MTPHDTASAAMIYIERGWAVIALHDVIGGSCSCGSADPRHAYKQGGKHPLDGGWQNRGMRTAAAVRDSWARRPGANLGIVTGRASGIWVLDVDPDNGGDKQLAGLVRAFGALPETYAVRTGSGGTHYYWTMPDFDFTNSRGRLPLGLDVRGNASQVVAPPSHTLKGGYAVVLDVDPVPAPGWILDMIRPPERLEPTEAVPYAGWDPGLVEAVAADRGPAYAATAVRELLAQLAGAGVGERNSTAYRIGRRLAELVGAGWSGLNADRVWAGYMEAAAVADVDGGFTQAEAYDVLTKACRDQQRAGRVAELPAAPHLGTVVNWAAPPDFDQAGQDPASIFTSPGQVPVMSQEQPVRSAWDEEVARAVGRILVNEEARRQVEDGKFLRTWRKPISHGDLGAELDLPESDVSWRITGMLPADGNAVVVAPRKTGKTTLVGDLVRSLVDGVPFLGFHCAAVTGGVALFNYENTERQQRAWLRALGIENVDRVHVMHLRGSALALNVPQVRAYVTQWLRERGVEVWIPDPYMRAAQGVVLNENDNGQANSFTGILDEIKTEAGVSEIVMPAHSSNKNVSEVESGSESMRGAGRVEDWADAIWYLTTVEGQRFIRATGRDVEMAETQLHFDAETRRLSIGRPGHGRRDVALEGDAAQLSRVLRDWTEATPPSQNQLSEACGGWRPQRIRAAVTWLTERNLIWTEPGPNNSKYHYHGAKPQSSDPSATPSATQVLRRSTQA